MNSRRPYHSSVRVEQAAATRGRILEAARTLLSSPTAVFTLDQVAADAGVSVQTVLRKFGTRRALMLAVVGSVRDPMQSSSPPRPDRPERLIRGLFDDYEEIGVRVLNMLAEEHRAPDLTEVIESGRAYHRQWVEQVFAPSLKGRRGRARRQLVDALVVSTDVYVWKLLRLDLGLDRAEAEAVALRLVAGVIADPTRSRARSPQPEES